MSKTNYSLDKPYEEAKEKLMLFFQDVEETQDEAVIAEMDRIIDSVMAEIENKWK